MSTGNILNNLIAQIKGKSESKILETANSSKNEFISVSQMSDSQFLLITLLIAAEIGIEGKKQINTKEKRLVDGVFGNMYTNMTGVYNFITQPVEEDKWRLIESLAQGGTRLGMPLLKFILCFAYVDGQLGDETAERLENAFGMTLIADFFAGEAEEVPQPSVRLTGLESEIVEWFRANDELKKLKDIQSHFSGKSKTEIQTALDSLCEKEILYKMDTISGVTYSLY